MSTQYCTHAKWWGIAGEARRERTLWPRVLPFLDFFFSLKSYWMSETMGVREGKERKTILWLASWKFQTPPPSPRWRLTLIPGSTLVVHEGRWLHYFSRAPQAKGKLLNRFLDPCTPSDMSRGVSSRMDLFSGFHASNSFRKVRQDYKRIP